MNFQSLYDGMPYPLQSLMLNGYSLKIHLQRYGADFRRLFAELEQTQWYDSGQIRRYQDDRLRTLVRHAYEYSPYYREVMDRRAIKPRDIESVGDLPKLPILEKSDVRKGYATLRSTAVPEKSVGKGSTSGTTGSPLTVAWDLPTQIVNNVVDWRQKKWGGIAYGDRIAQILGRTIVAIDRKRPPFWQQDFLHNQLWMSAFHLRADYLQHYVQKLIRYAPDAIEGYPSTVVELARFIHEAKTKRPKPRAIFTSSEPLLPEHRELVEDVFQAPVFDFYGTAERVLFATQCDRHHGQHVNFEFGVLEVVDAEGQPCAPDQEGEIVATSLWNLAMPMLRYRVGDRTRLLPQTCSCGRSAPLMTCVQTKHEDAIVRPDGTHISPSILTHPFKPISSIERSQVVQTHKDKIEIRIVRRAEFNQNDEDRLLQEFRRRVGSSMHVVVTYPQEIPRTRSGKYRWVVNETLRPAKVADNESPTP